jgi:hypothetical protein
MASLDRATIRGTIRFLGDFQNVRKFPDADLNREIQRKFDRFWAIVDECNEGWWDTEGTVTTVGGQAYIALPADAKTVKGVDRLDGTEYRPLAQVGISARNRYGSTRNDPVAYRLSARGLELLPTPNAAYTLRVIYTPKPATLDESTPREWYEGWEDFIINGVIFELKEREGMPGAGTFRAKMSDAEATLRASASRRRQAEPEYLVLREYDDLDPYSDGVY